MVLIFKVIAFAINISAHVLTLGSNPKDSVLFENYLSPMQVKLQFSTFFSHPLKRLNLSMDQLIRQ